MDGLAAAAEIRRQERPGHRPVIVAMTADVSAQQRERCRRGGMDDFLEKPLRTHVLAGVLNRYARRAHELPASRAAGTNRRRHVPQVDLLEADIGPELTLDLVREYLAGAEQAVERLERDPLDDATVHSDAHRLLGGARILGLGTFEDLWQTLTEESADRRAGRNDRRAAPGLHGAQGLD